MKQSSIDKLSRIYNFLDEAGQTSLSELIKEVIRAECPPVGASKFDIYKFVHPKEKYYRKQIQGVFYDGEYRVATDTVKLIAQKGEWPEELQGKIVRKDGSIIEGTFPGWQQIIPQNLSQYEPYKLDKEEIAKKIADFRSEHKAEYGRSLQWGYWPIEVGGVSFSAKHLWRFIEAGIDTLFIHEKEGSHRAAIIKTDEFLGAVMPIIKD